MVQVLPYVPSFGERLVPEIGQAVGNISQGLQNRAQNQSDQRIIQSFDPNDSPMNQIQKFSRLSRGKQDSLSPLFQQMLKTQGQQQGPQQQQMQEHEDISKTINSLVDTLAEGKVGLGNIFNKVTAEGRESRAYYDELALGVERRLADMVGKGALSKTRFDYLKSKLPSSSDTDATNRGKLRSLAEEFKVDIKNPEFKKLLKQEGESVNQEEAPQAKQGFTWLISPSGKKVQVPNDQVKAALSSGGKRE